MAPGIPTDSSTHRHYLHHQGPHGYQSAFQTQTFPGDLGSSSCLPARPAQFTSVLGHSPQGPPLSGDRACRPLPPSPCRPLHAPCAPCRSLPLPAASRHDLPSLVPSCWPTLGPSGSLQCHYLPPRPPRVWPQPSTALSGVQRPAAWESLGWGPAGCWQVLR